MEEFSSLTSTEGALDLTYGPKIKSVTVIWKTTRGNSVLETNNPKTCRHIRLYVSCVMYMFRLLDCTLLKLNVFKFVRLCKISANINIYKNQTSYVP